MPHHLHGRQTEDNRPLGTAPIEQIADRFFELFGVDVRSYPVTCSSHGLMPWELGCCLILEDGSVAIQIRPDVKTTWWSRLGPHIDAVLAHELIHATRSQLHGPRSADCLDVFEEFCAYSGCKAMLPSKISAWRVFWGPLFSSTLETVLVLTAFWAAPIVAWLFDLDLLLLLCFPLGLLAILVVRLAHRWTVWNRACATLVAQDADTAWRRIIRLTDDGVRMYALGGRGDGEQSWNGEGEQPTQPGR